MSAYSNPIDPVFGLFFNTPIIPLDDS